MLNEREMKYRMKCAKDQNIPFTNYGTAIAYMQGIISENGDKSSGNSRPEDVSIVSFLPV